MKIKDIKNIYRIFDRSVLKYLGGIDKIKDEQDYKNKKSALEQICPPCGIRRSKSLFGLYSLGVL